MKDKISIILSFAWLRWMLRFRSTSELHIFQLKMLNKQFGYLRQKSPYFQDLPVLTTLDDLRQIPIMSKQIMMDNFNEMNTVGVEVQDALKLAIDEERSRQFTSLHNDLSFGLSSGTSGHRGLFVVSRVERRLWAAAVLAKFLPRRKLSGHRIAFFLRANNNLYEAVGSHFIKFEYFDIYQDMDAHIARLKTYQPTILVAPPSVLAVLADAVERGLLKLSPQKIISVAEVLTSADEHRFKHVFNVSVIHQAYQCTEGFVAYSCEDGTIHINEDSVYVEKEWIDDVRYVPIITDFRRKSQPIVRYRLNDVIRQRLTPCSCGSYFEMIETIEGREDDIFYFDSTNDGTTRVYADMLGRCMLYVKGLSEYRIVQTAPRKIVIYLAYDTSAIRAQIKNELGQLADRLQFSMPRIQFAAYERDLTKKLKRIERTFDIS
ncbi:CoF synthetase [Candidatus Saccharibacteria bacterium]|nr:CoF synthetase [Candidatus Saccharibacteria bacterium]